MTDIKQGLPSDDELHQFFKDPLHNLVPAVTVTTNSNGTTQRSTTISSSVLHAFLVQYADRTPYVQDLREKHDRLAERLAELGRLPVVERPEMPRCDRYWENHPAVHLTNVVIWGTAGWDAYEKLAKQIKGGVL